MWPNGTITNLVQKHWNIEDIETDITIYNICPGVNATYFYGDYNTFTIIATEKHAMVYNIVPIKDGNDWDQDNLYFVGSLGYKVIWRFSLTSDDNNVSWYDPKLQEENFILRIRLKIEENAFLYSTIITSNSTVFCKLDLQTLMVYESKQYYSIEIHSVILSDKIGLLGNLKLKEF